MTLIRARKESPPDLANDVLQVQDNQTTLQLELLIEDGANGRLTSCEMLPVIKSSGISSGRRQAQDGVISATPSVPETELRLPETNDSSSDSLANQPSRHSPESRLEEGIMTRISPPSVRSTIGKLQACEPTSTTRRHEKIERDVAYG